MYTLKKRGSTYAGGQWQAGYYSVDSHAFFGKTTGALPDGRYKGDALASSLSPMAGTDNNGPTAVINSLNKIDMSEFANGMVLDMKFLPVFIKEKKYRYAIQMLVEEYFDKGGMEIQFNVVDKVTLEEAKRNPAKYSNLIVRVSGFSAYFVSLEENLQDEIIRRTEHMNC